MATLIEIVDLVANFYTYEGVVKALNKVSLKIDHGCTFGLVGESGCGKSVTARSMLRLVPEPGRIEGGKIFFNPEDGADQNVLDLMEQSEAYMQDLRGNKISMIFQEPNTALNPIMSIGEQVAESYLFHRRNDLCKGILAKLDSPQCTFLFPIRQYLQFVYRIAVQNQNSIILKVLGRLPALKFWKRLLRREAIQRSISLLAKLGISNPDEVVKQHPHNLSGGMKQRIVIAIALACHPLLLIADEATSNLDVTIQAQILKLLKELKKEEISAVLLITHDLGIVAETCDRVGVMYAGNLCEVADLKDLFEDPKHPYTRALLDSVPKFSQAGELKSIEGNVPNLVNPPAGCRFHPRCQHAMDICQQTFPAMKEVNENHIVACYWVEQNGKDNRAKRS